MTSHSAGTKCALQVCVFVVLVSMSGTLPAADKLWDNASGGFFSTSANWFPGVPGLGDVARFGITDSSFFQRSYVVRFVSSPTNQQLVVEDDSVGFINSDFFGHSYSLTNSFVGAALGTVSGRS